MVVQDQYETGEIEDMTRDSFVFLGRYMKSFTKLNMEQRGILITAMMSYQIGDKLPEMDAITDMAFSFIKDDMDFNNQKYDEKCERNRENGKKGGRPKANGFSENPQKANGFSENPTKPTKTLSESESESESNKKDILSGAVSEIIDYLNEKAGTHYGKTTKQTVGHIKARLDEGFTVEDFKTVIDKQAKWKKDPMMCTYLRPETLFCPSHFESYLNEIEAPSEKPAQPTVYGKVHNFAERKVDYAALGAELINDQ